MTLRVLFVCPDMRVGGAERHWATLAPMLRERGAEVGVLCLSEEGALYADLARAGVATACLHMPGPLDPRGVRRALGFARPRPDVVISRGVTGMLAAAAIARRGRAPHVVNEHTPLLASGELLAMEAHQRMLTRLVAPHVEGVIAVTARQVDPLTRLGYRRERIEVIPNGIAPPDPVSAARLAGDGEFAVLCAARLQIEKRADRFVRAVAGARRSDPGIRGFLVGDGSERGALERLAAGSGVELLGERSDVPSLLAGADAFMLTSDAEALPISILEAMAYGVPVIAPDLGGTPELVAHGETGLVVPPGDVPALERALVELASDPGLARQLGVAGRVRQRERFDAGAMADAYLSALQRVASGD
jgi:glycosyltransferase involved in cell wall biosynthesis